MTNVGKAFKDAVLAGKVAGITADPDNPALAYDDMDIYSPAGAKVRFTGYGGHDWEQKRAREVGKGAGEQGPGSMIAALEKPVAAPNISPDDPRVAQAQAVYERLCAEVAA